MRIRTAMCFAFASLAAGAVLLSTGPPPADPTAAGIEFVVLEKAPPTRTAERECRH